jgi:integrase
VRLRAFWRWAFEKDKYKGSMIHPDVFRNSSFKRVIPATRAKKDTLEKSQLKAWFENVGEIANPVIAGYLQCLLLTGARRNELAKVKWTDIDFQWRKIHLHDKVREEGRDIPLTPYVGFLLNSLERKGEYVFHSANSKTGYIAEPRFGHKKALKNAGISTELSLHGLRRSFATLNEWVESPAGVIAQIQGHAASAVQERHYKNRPLELLAKWHVKFEAWVLEQSEIEFNEQAVQEGLHAV